MRVLFIWPPTTNHWNFCRLINAATTETIRPINSTQRNVLYYRTRTSGGRVDNFSCTIDCLRQRLAKIVSTVCMHRVITSHHNNSSTSSAKKMIKTQSTNVFSPLANCPTHISDPRACFSHVLFNLSPVTPLSKTQSNNISSSTIDRSGG